jgi:hypothetical protein
MPAPSWRWAHLPVWWLPVFDPTILRESRIVVTPALRACKAPNRLPR